MPTKTLERTPRVSKIKIERNIPLPKYTKMPAKNDLVEDLKRMKPLESRVINVEYNEQTLNAQRTRIHDIQKKESLGDRKFTVNIDPVTQEKSENDKHVKVLMRVWRVA
jgi:hypothetical protein